MTLEQFKEKVLEKLRQYAVDKTEQELVDAMDEYQDIIADGYDHFRGVEYGCDYAAWNISMCL